VVATSEEEVVVATSEEVAADTSEEAVSTSVAAGCLILVEAVSMEIISEGSASVAADCAWAGSLRVECHAGHSILEATSCRQDVHSQTCMACRGGAECSRRALRRGFQGELSHAKPSRIMGSSTSIASGYSVGPAPCSGLTRTTTSTAMSSGAIGALAAPILIGASPTAIRFGTMATATFMADYSRRLVWTILPRTRRTGPGGDAARSRLSQRHRGRSPLRCVGTTPEKLPTGRSIVSGSWCRRMISNTACPTSVAFTPTGRLAGMQQRIEAMEQAVDVVSGPLDRFYGALTDEQKAKLNSADQAQAQPNASSRGLAQSCSKSAATEWPEARIESAVRPNEEQQAKLKALQSAATQAAEELAAACPSEMPTTPSARLAAVSKRLDVMLQAVKSVRVALDDFYGDLNDEQKAQFNRIGQSRTAQR
jgi:LTXXQ motif family protein